MCAVKVLLVVMKRPRNEVGVKSVGGDGLHCASVCVTQDLSDNNQLGMPYMLCIPEHYLLINLMCCSIVS